MGTTYINQEDRVSDPIVTIHNADELKRALKSNPVFLLLVCMGSYETYEEQVDTVRKTVAACRHTLAAGKVAEEFAVRFSGMYQVKGSPTCLVFKDGRVRDRILGFTDRDTLIDRMNLTLQSQTTNNIHHMED